MQKRNIWQRKCNSVLPKQQLNNSTINFSLKLCAICQTCSLIAKRRAPNISFSSKCGAHVVFQCFLCGPYSDAIFSFFHNNWTKIGCMNRSWHAFKHHVSSSIMDETRFELTTFQSWFTSSLPAYMCWWNWSLEEMLTHCRRSVRINTCKYKLAVLSKLLRYWVTFLLTYLALRALAVRSRWALPVPLCRLF